MKPPLVLFKMRGRTVKQKRLMHMRKEVKNIKKELGKSFLELICFIFYLSFKKNTSLRLCVFILCCQSFIYALLEAFIEKYFFNSCLIKLSKIFEKYL